MYRFRWLAIITIILFYLIQPEANARKWALLVGVNDYISHPEVQRLRGCENDVKLMTETLERFGFAPEDMKILLSREATREAILAEFRRWLIAKPKADDVVVFYFSGHGSRVVDESGDEDDGWDEILCPVDIVPIPERENYKNPILDDELGALIDQIPTQNVTVILDSCHSGTATKDLAIPKRILTRDLSLRARERPNRPSSERQSSDIELQENKNHVLISGSAAEEVSLDAQWPGGYFAGVLTKNLVEALNQANENTRYVDLKERVSAGVKQRSQQTPQFEGKIDRPIFSIQTPEGRFRPSFTPAAKPYVTLTQVAGNRATVNAGLVRGITEGSLYEIFSPTEISFSGASLGLMRIVSVRNDSATGEILKGIGAIEPRCRAVESVRAYAPDRLYLELRWSGDTRQKKRLQEALSTIKDVVLAEYGRYADVMVEVEADNAQLKGKLTAQDGVLLEETSASDAEGLVVGLRPKLESAFVFKKLLNLKNPSPPFRIKVWSDKGQRPVYQIGEAAVFKFESERDCYLTLLNVDTQGQIFMLFPNKYHPSNKIFANRTYTIPSADMKFKLAARPPAGKQLIKAIATTEPLNIDELDLNRTNDFFLSVGGSKELAGITRGLSKELYARPFVPIGDDEKPDSGTATSGSSAPTNPPGAAVSQSSTPASGPSFTSSLSVAGGSDDGNILHLPTSNWTTGELIGEIQ